MNDTLQNYYDKNNGRLPTAQIKEEPTNNGTFNFNTMKYEKNVKEISNSSQAPHKR